MKMASVGMALLLGICLALLAAACEAGEEQATATPTATAAATAIASPTASPPPSPSPPAATPTAAPETPPPAATPTGRPPTPEVAACPDDDSAFCAFTAQVERAIAEEDAGFFVANSLTESVLCTAEAADVGYVCGPEQIGETITGIPYGRESSEGTLVLPDDYRSFWAQIFASAMSGEEDIEGSGELRIWGLAYPLLPAEGTPRNIVVTYISDTGLGLERQAISLHCELADGQWQIKSLLQHILALASPRDTSAEWRDWPE
jgi:hypothetical protein